MRKTSKFLCVLLTLCAVFGVTGCYEGGPDKGGAMATAIALGHSNCITEVTVVIDGYGNPTKIIFDDIFPASNVYNTNLGADAPKVTIDNKEYYQYLRIGNKYFEVQNDGKYNEIGATNGITDLVEYCKTDEGVQWYYDSFIAGAMQICVVSDEGTQVGNSDLKLADKYKFNTANGSMRKRYSKYWSASANGGIGQVTGRGFNGNMDALEAYLLAYGFDNVDNVVLPNGDSNKTNYNIIGGITTGATLSADTGIYLKVAKAAYDKALALQK